MNGLTRVLGWLKLTKAAADARSRVSGSRARLTHSLRGTFRLDGMEAAMTGRDAVLVLLDVLRSRWGRPVRVSDLYLYTREALVRGAVSAELADSLRNADPSTIYLILEDLRSAG